jgi:hypothetical protein
MLINLDPPLEAGRPPRRLLSAVPSGRMAWPLSEEKVMRRRWFLLIALPQHSSSRLFSGLRAMARGGFFSRYAHELVA